MNATLSETLRSTLLHDIALLMPESPEHVGWVEQRETHRSRKEFDGFRYRSTHPTKLKASSLDEVKRNREIRFDYL